MLTRDFHKMLDKELESLLIKYKDDAFLKKHKSSPNNQKSYALLIWFLEHYGRKSNYQDFITDGEEDGSCDIMFDRNDNFGDKIFYIVQSKWNIEDKCVKETDKDEILKALSDFETLLRGGKNKVNDKMRRKLQELNEHMNENGEVKFVFLSLSRYLGNAEENIASFVKNQQKTSFEVIDIERLKINFIDRKYKKIEPENPLENHPNPEESPIVLRIERLTNQGNHIQIQKPFEAFVFLLRPKTIFELFEKYGFSLFYKNVRNPLLQSHFNKDIERTAVENPAYFWYYNNGITAITYLLPAVRSQASTIQLTGLQIINGAQTVYSVYRAYKSASPTKRAQMDSEALITMRLLKSGGKDFDLNVSKFTNSQNPVKDRDFRANDEVQVRLQQSSYEYRYWYEKRRDEFRELPEGVHKVPNHLFANVYLAYQLQDPFGVLLNHNQGRKTKKDLNFISHKDHKDGRYERIFSPESDFSDMLCAFYLFKLLHNETSYKNTFSSNLYHLLALFKVAFSKYLVKKYDEKINVNRKIIQLYENQELEILLKTFKFINRFVEKQVEMTEDQQRNAAKVFMALMNPPQYEKVKSQLEDLDLRVEAIEGIELENSEDLVIGLNEDLYAADAD